MTQEQMQKQMETIKFSNYQVEEQIGKRYKFILRHQGNDRSKDIEVEAFVDEEGKKVEWNENMPFSIRLALDTFKFFDLKRHTKECLMLAVN